MTTQDLKLSIVDLLEDTSDAEVLQSIYVLLTRIQPTEQDDIAGYEADGEPITEEALVASILEGSREARAGQKISMENMRAELHI